MKRTQLLLRIFIFILPVFMLLFLLKSCSKDNDTKTPLQLINIIYNYNQGYYEFQYNEDETLASIKCLDNEDEGEYVTCDFTWQDDKINTVDVVNRNADGSVYSNEQNFEYTYNEQETIVTEYYQDDTLVHRYYKNSQNQVEHIIFGSSNEDVFTWNGEDISSSEYNYGTYIFETEYSYSDNINSFSLINHDVLIWLRLFDDQIIRNYFINSFLSYNNCIHLETTFSSNGNSYIITNIDYSYSINVYHRPSIITGSKERFSSDGTLEYEEDFQLEFVYKK